MSGRMNWQRCVGVRKCTWCNKKIDTGEMFVENRHGYHQGWNYCVNCIIKMGKKAQEHKEENDIVVKVPLKERKIKLKMLGNLLI